jgi:hypothetical protein
MLRRPILALWAALSAMPALAESRLAMAGAANGLYLSRDRGVTRCRRRSARAC